MRRLATALAAAAVTVAACSPDQQAADSADRAALRAPASDPTPSTIGLRKIGGYVDGRLTAAEITAYDFVSKRLFVVNGALGDVDVLDLRDPENPRKIATIDEGAPVNSVAADGGVVAIAVEGATKTAPGKVAFYRATTLALISEATVGALPDMVTFTPSGKYVVVANEGEPSDDYGIDPEGSVSIIDVSNVNRPTVRTATFAAFNGQADALRAQGVRLFGPPGTTVAQDVEPEYVAVNADETTAYVTLQEANAVAVVDLASATVSAIVPLGFKDHSRPGNGLDASDRDNAVNIQPWPIFGMYQPDAIAAFEVNGQTYLITANEGDAREWGTFVEEVRVSSLAAQLDPAVFTSAACGGSCTANSRLGRLNVTNRLGRNPATGLFDRLYAFGARSFTIWTATGQLVYDSGDQLEQLTRSLPNAAFNASNTGNAPDDRSDNKGPEPEGVVIGRLGEKTFAFIGLERVGGVVAVDVSNPAAPQIAAYVNSRAGDAGDRGPEGIEFVPAVRSPSKRPLVIVGHETSGSTAIYEVELR
jgi:DNA-binding beta-propeller fold protein YncE